MIFSYIFTELAPMVLRMVVFLVVVMLVGMGLVLCLHCDWCGLRACVGLGVVVCACMGVGQVEVVGAGVDVGVWVWVSSSTSRVLSSIELDLTGLN